MYKDPNARYGSGGLRGPTYKGLAPPDDTAAWSESDGTVFRKVMS
jgi:hypothetical protein